MSSTKTQKLQGRKTTQRSGSRRRGMDKGGPKQQRLGAMKALGAEARKERVTLALSGRPLASRASGT